MDLVTHFQMLARYNRIANERLIAVCALLDDAEYRQHRAGSFGSIHGLLNHILLGDRRWMALFERGDRATPPLNQILYDDFLSLRSESARGPADRVVLQRARCCVLGPLVCLYEQPGQRLR